MPPQHREGLGAAVPLVDYAITGAVRLTSPSLRHQELKRCRVRSVPLCTSVAFFGLALIYSWLFSAIGLQTSLHQSIEVPYGERCKSDPLCLVDFEIKENFSDDVGLYYKITEFSQMRRDIAASFQPDMLRGMKVSENELESCSPEIYLNNTKNPGNLLIPCGLLPRSVFNDSFTPLAPLPEFSDSDITLNVDANNLYKSPNQAYANAIDWLSGSGFFPGGQTNPHFIVWMRQSAFMPFRKLYGVTHNGLVAGNYTMLVHNMYDVSGFGGEKYFVLAEFGRFGTTKWGAATIFGLMAGMFFVASAALGFIGWRRQRPLSPFHPDQLKDILRNEGK
jgi:hypothetical protein